MFELKKLPKNIPGLYFVKKGQTIKQISEYFSIPEHIIISQNNLKDEVECGDFLIIPDISDKKIIKYSVGVGDTLDSVCKKFKVQKEDFEKLNGVDYVWVGMEAWLSCNN